MASNVFYGSALRDQSLSSGVSLCNEYKYVRDEVCAIMEGFNVHNYM